MSQSTVSILFPKKNFNFDNNFKGRENSNNQRLILYVIPWKVNIKVDFTSLKIEETFRNLQYLDLACNFKDRNIISLDNYKFICRFNKSFKHILHSSSDHLNSITDLIISLGIALERFNNSDNRILEKLTTAVFENKRNIKKNIENSDFIKNQSEEIIKEIKKTKRNLPSIEDIRSLSYQLEHSKPKQIEIETKEILKRVEDKTKTVEEQYIKVEKLLKHIQGLVDS